MAILAGAYCVDLSMAILAGAYCVDLSMAILAGTYCVDLSMVILAGACCVDSSMAESSCVVVPVVGSAGGLVTIDRPISMLITYLLLTIVLVTCLYGLLVPNFH